MLRPTIISVTSLFIILFSGIQSAVGQFTESLPCLYKNYNISAIIAVDSMSRDSIISYDQIDSILFQTSAFFEPICMSFSLCETTIMEKDYTLGILLDKPIPMEKRMEELTNRFAKRKRINIFFLKSIDTETCGNSIFNGIETLHNANVYVDLSCEEGPAEQIAHHLGHLFGLRDTYDEDTIELVDGSNCATTGDRICDTPADPFGQTYINPQDIIRLQEEELIDDFISDDCIFIYEYRDPNDEFYSPLVNNVMSAYPCKCTFTREQLLFIVDKYNQSPIKQF